MALPDHIQKDMDKIREYLPIMAAAAGLSSDQEFKRIETMEFDDLAAEIEIGDGLLVCLAYEWGSQGILENSQVRLKDVEVFVVYPNGGGYLDPPDIEEHSIYKGSSLVEGLKQIVLQDRIQAINAALENFEQQRQLQEAESMYADVQEEFGIRPR